MVTAICNVFIDSEFKLELFKETFQRVYGVSDNWLVYIRGKYSEDVVKYIQEAFPDYEKNCIFFSGLYSNNWVRSTTEMLKSSRYEYVYTFLEDHILMKPLGHFKNVIQEMSKLKIEYFGYSFFNIGLSVQSSEGLYPDYSKYFFSFYLSQGDMEYLKKNNHHFYPHSLTSVCSKRHFRNVLEIENMRLIHVPFLVQALMENVFFFYPRNRAFWFNVNKFVSRLGMRFVIYLPETPFNLEKSLFDCDTQLLPLMIGGLREELFANWDDDNILSNSSLMKRGLYPLTLKSTVSVSGYESTMGREYQLLKGMIETKQFYPEMSRISHVPIKQILVKNGTAKIYSDKEVYTLNKGEGMCVHANVPHQIEALEDITYFTKIYLKP
ncbi:MAG: hypothetical protein O3A36_02040 [bacterium]|nr:hypothetical protein [bacterium]